MGLQVAAELPEHRLSLAVKALEASLRSDYCLLKKLGTQSFAVTFASYTPITRHQTTLVSLLQLVLVMFELQVKEALPAPADFHPRMGRTPNMIKKRERESNRKALYSFVHENFHDAIEWLQPVSENRFYEAHEDVVAFRQRIVHIEIVDKLAWVIFNNFYSEAASPHIELIAEWLSSVIPDKQLTIKDYLAAEDIARNIEECCEALADTHPDKSSLKMILNFYKTDPKSWSDSTKQELIGSFKRENLAVPASCSSKV